MSNIKINNLSLIKKGERILENICLELIEGEKYLIYGRNGAGKSTLFKCITGLEKAYQGVVKLNGNTVTYLPENEDIPDQIKVQSYMNSFVNIFREKGRYLPETHMYLEKEFNLTAFSNSYFGEISKGMKKLVFLTITLISDSHLIVLDEPLEGLDMINKEFLIDFLSSEAAKGKIIFLSSHEISSLNRKFDHLISLRKGRITKIFQNQEDLTYKKMLSFI